MARRGGRDVNETRDSVSVWLARKLGVEQLDIEEVSVPKAGFSNETVLFRARWEDESGAHDQELVLRIEPTKHQLFLKPDAMLQAAMMTGLAKHVGTPAPQILFTEQDTTWFGAPFFVMRRIRAAVPADMPSFHASGWTAELAPEQVSVLYDNALSALAALHRIDWEDGFEFLGAGRAGKAWPEYLAELAHFYQWSESSQLFDAEDLKHAFEWVLEHAPTDDNEERIIWGDARVGNMMFADDLSVAAMLDWEGATVGPPGIDLGWWLMFEDFLSGAQGVARLPGAPDRVETIRRYEKFSGRPVPHADYYEVVACVLMSLINSRLGDLLMRNHGMTNEAAGEYARRTIRMATTRIAGLSSGH